MCQMQEKVFVCSGVGGSGALVAITLVQQIERKQREIDRQRERAKGRKRERERESERERGPRKKRKNDKRIRRFLPSHPLPQILLITRRVVV